MPTRCYLHFLETDFLKPTSQLKTLEKCPIPREDTLIQQVVINIISKKNIHQHRLRLDFTMKRGSAKAFHVKWAGFGRTVQNFVHARVVVVDFGV